MTGNEQRLFIATCCNAPTLTKILKKYLTCTLRRLIHEQGFRNKTLTIIQNANPFRKLGTHLAALVVQSWKPPHVPNMILLWIAILTNDYIKMGSN
jgi:hypothetical protein